MKTPEQALKDFCKESGLNEDRLVEHGYRMVECICGCGGWMLEIPLKVKQ